MTGSGKKLEPKLSLEMDFGEALERFARTDPKELAQSIERGKTKKPPGENAPRRPPRPSRHSTLSVGGKLRKPT